MEIEKGLCDFCSADRVLCEIKTRKFQKLLKSLFNQHINVELLEDVFKSFRLCPLCHEKFILLDTRCKAIKSQKKGINCDQCILCGDEDELYKIKKWPHFDRLSKDFDFDSDTVLICPACLVYLDTRNTIKQHLIHQNHKSKRSSQSTHWNHFEVCSSEKHQETPPNIKRGIKTLKQQGKVLPKALINNHKLYSSILYVRLTNCDFSDTGLSYGKAEHTVQYNKKAQLKLSNDNFQTDSSNKNMEFQIVSCSNTRKSAFKIKFKSLTNKADSPPVSKQSKSPSVSKMKKLSRYQTNELSKKTIKKLLKEHHMLKELSVLITREDLEKKQECSLYNSNTIIICDSDEDDDEESDGLIKNAINKILDEADPLDIPEFHSDGDKVTEGKRTRRSSARRKINEYEDSTKDSTYGEAVNTKTKRTRKQKTPSKRPKLDINARGSDSDENDSKAFDKEKSEEFKNQKVTDSSKSDSKEEDNEDAKNINTRDRQKAKKLKKQTGNEEYEPDGGKKQNKSKGDATVGENEEELSDDSDKDTKRKSKPRKHIHTESDEEPTMNITEVKPDKNKDVPEIITESDVVEIDKVETIHKDSEETLQEEEETETQGDSKEDKTGDTTDDIGIEPSHTSDQTEANTENNEKENEQSTLEENVREDSSPKEDNIECADASESGKSFAENEDEQSTLEENIQNDSNPKKDSSIEGAGASESGKSFAEKEEAQVDESEDQNEQENSLGDKLSDPEAVVTDKNGSENDRNNIEEHEVVHNRETNTLEHVETDLDQNKECEEQNKQENKDNDLEVIESEVTSSNASGCADELNNKNGDCEITDSEGNKLEGVSEEKGEDGEENTKKRKSFDEISNEPKKSKVVDDAKSPLDDNDDDGIEKKMANMLGQSPPKSHPVLFALSDTEDGDSEANENKKEDKDSDQNIERFAKQDSANSKEKASSNNGHIYDVNETLDNTVGEEQLSGCADEEKCEDVSNSSIGSNGSEKKKKRVTFNEESNVTFE